MAAPRTPAKTAPTRPTSRMAAPAVATAVAEEDDEVLELLEEEEEEEVVAAAAVVLEELLPVSLLLPESPVADAVADATAPSEVHTGKEEASPASSVHSAIAEL
ncbi:hypothetical protein M406DRAFT_355422, partial [Cryphonectria parasitica EP155]